MVNEIQSFKRQSCEKIDNKPTFKIMLGNHLLLSDDSARFFVDVCCAKIDENIDDEKHFNNTVSNDQLSSMVMGFECYIKRNHNCYVAHEYKNYPIPDQTRPSKVENHESR